MDLVILEKIEYSILNGLGYIERLEKKNGNSPIIYGWPMQQHRSFSRRSKAESEKLSEETESFWEEITVNDYYKSKTTKYIGHFRDHSATAPGLPAILSLIADGLAWK